MPRKKTSDPVLIALLDQRQKAIAEYDRWYTRLKRAFTRLEKANQKIGRLDRRIEKHQQQTTNTDTSSKETDR